jgi:hypothetical protein
MNRQWKGIVFMDFRDENAPHFILSLIEELQREKIAESIAPCQTFAKSFMMISPATGRKDLVLLLRPLTEEAMDRLETWRNNQGEQMVMILSEYVKQYSAEFTGIGQLGKADGSEMKNEQKIDNPPQKPKKDRKKRNRSSKQVNDNTEKESDVETPESSENVGVPEENEGIEQDEEVETPENENPGEIENEGT